VTDTATLDLAFAQTMATVVETGTAPHYTEIAARLGEPPAAGRRIIADLMSAGVPGWVHPGTDYIASFPPFNIQPTQYRVTVDGEQRWYAQCGFEALAIRWMFPGRTVRIDAPCLDCGEQLTVEMRDEEVLAIEPGTMVGYTRSPVGGSPEDRPFR
jgi:hypothetical protein